MVRRVTKAISKTRARGAAGPPGPQGPPGRPGKDGKDGVSPPPRFRVVRSSTDGGMAKPAMCAVDETMMSATGIAKMSRSLAVCAPHRVESEPESLPAVSQRPGVAEVCRQ